MGIKIGIKIFEVFRKGKGIFYYMLINSKWLQEENKNLCKSGLWFLDNPYQIPGVEPAGYKLL